MLRLFPNSAETPLFYSIYLVNSGYHGAVGSASAWKTRGHVFEPVLMRFYLCEKYPGS